MPKRSPAILQFFENIVTGKKKHYAHYMAAHTQGLDEYQLFQTTLNRPTMKADS
jgi:hypothetical protein